eukprot:TRINITY_DN13263_c0_g1_i2.p1 TRINITY_DN13263_c0_g1~~TRINITY_DN13263_c0_g1_i2.p1  ORF type:complete len:995 (-),score=205.68 TRINITY_DN13263_c0_g1_i2:11-2776(-)
MSLINYFFEFFSVLSLHFTAVKSHLVSITTVVGGNPPPEPRVGINVELMDYITCFLPTSPETTGGLTLMIGNLSISTQFLWKLSDMIQNFMKLFIQCGDLRVYSEVVDVGVKRISQIMSPATLEVEIFVPTENHDLHGPNAYVVLRSRDLMKLAVDHVDILHFLKVISGNFLKQVSLIDEELEEISRLIGEPSGVSGVEYSPYVTTDLHLSFSHFLIHLLDEGYQCNHVGDDLDWKGTPLLEMDLCNLKADVVVNSSQATVFDMSLSEFYLNYPSTVDRKYTTLLSILTKSELPGIVMKCSADAIATDLHLNFGVEGLTVIPYLAAIRHVMDYGISYLLKPLEKILDEFLGIKMLVLRSRQEDLCRKGKLKENSVLVNRLQLALYVKSSLLLIPGSWERGAEIPTLFLPLNEVTMAVHNSSSLTEISSRSSVDLRIEPYLAFMSFDKNQFVTSRETPLLKLPLTLKHMFTKTNEICNEVLELDVPKLEIRASPQVVSTFMEFYPTWFPFFEALQSSPLMNQSTSQRPKMEHVGTSNLSLKFRISEIKLLLEHSRSEFQLPERVNLTSSQRMKIHHHHHHHVSFQVQKLSRSPSTPRRQQQQQDLKPVVIVIFGLFELDAKVDQKESDIKIFVDRCHVLGPMGEEDLPIIVSQQEKRTKKASQFFFFKFKSSVDLDKVNIGIGSLTVRLDRVVVYELLYSCTGIVSEISESFVRNIRSKKDMTFKESPKITGFQKNSQTSITMNGITLELLQMETCFLSLKVFYLSLKVKDAITKQIGYGCGGGAGRSSSGGGGGAWGYETRHTTKFTVIVGSFGIFADIDGQERDLVTIVSRDQIPFLSCKICSSDDATDPSQAYDKYLSLKSASFDLIIINSVLGQVLSYFRGYPPLLESHVTNISTNLQTLITEIPKKKKKKKKKSTLR